MFKKLHRKSNSSKAVVLWEIQSLLTENVIKVTLCTRIAFIQYKTIANIIYAYFEAS